MAKVTYTKLGAKTNGAIKTIEINGQNIEVRQYLPVNDKLVLIGNVIELSHDLERNFSNPLKTEVFFTLELIQAYTNITFTEKQMEEPHKLFDALSSTEGLLDKIMEAIPESELIILRKNLRATISAFYAYRNSIFGILDSVAKDYSDLDLDVNALQEKLANPEALALLKKITEGLG